MAKTESAKKQARQNVKRNLANRSYMSKVKTAVKKFQAAIQAQTGEEAGKALTHAQSFLMKAATKGIIHKNNASRHISRLAAMLAKKQKAS